MACDESELNGKRKVSPLVAKAFWKEAKAHYDSGKDFGQTVEAMAKKSNLRRSTVADILTSDKRLKAITNDAWVKRSKYNDITRSAERLVEYTDTPRWRQYAGKAWDAARSVATLGHGGVFPFTHERNLLYSGSSTEMGIFKDSVKRAYSYFDRPKALGGNKYGTARHAEDMAKMQLRPSYTNALRLGLDIHPSSEPVGILASGARGWGRRGFDSIKIARLDLWDHLASKLPEDMRDELSGRMLANEINHATGSIRLPTTPQGKPHAVSQIATTGMFAPKLWFAKRMEAFQPLRYLVKAGKMTVQERSVANIALRRWAKITGVTAGLLVANDALNKYVLKNDKRVNWDDFSTPGTLWRMNIGGQIIPMSPLVETIRTPVAFIAAMMARKRDLRGDAPLTSASRLVLKDFLNAIHPTLSNAAELISGREAYGTPGHLRRLPFKGAAQLVRGEETEKEPPLGWGEYLAERGPIPLSSGVRSFVESAKEEGASDTQANNWVKALLQSALSGGAGVHTFQESAPKSHRNTPMSEFREPKEKGGN